MKKGIGLGWSVFRKQDKMLKVSPVVLKAKGLQPVLSLSHDKGRTWILTKSVKKTEKSLKRGREKQVKITKIDKKNS